MFVWLKNRLVGIAAIVGFLTLLVLLLTLAARWHFLFDMLTHGRLQYCLALLISGICLLLFGKKYRYGTIVFLCGIGLLISMSNFFIPNKDNKASSLAKQKLRVLSLNVLTSNQAKDRVIDYINSEQPDIIIVSEIDEKWRAALDGAFSKSHRYTKIHTSWDNFGIGVYSNVPFEPGSRIMYHGDYQIAYLDLYFNQKQKFRVVGMHPVPPSNASYWLARNQQMADTTKLIAAQPDIPTIVCGDLNCSPWSPFYRDMLKDANLRNATEGFGIWPTWTAFSILLGLPIDHVLVSSKVQVLDHRVGQNVGSDHRGITVDLAF